MLGIFWRRDNSDSLEHVGDGGGSVPVPRLLPEPPADPRQRVDRQRTLVVLKVPEETHDLVVEQLVLVEVPVFSGFVPPPVCAEKENDTGYKRHLCCAARTVLDPHHE